MRLGKADVKSLLVKQVTFLDSGHGVDGAAERHLRQNEAQCGLEAGGSEVRKWLRTFSSLVLENF